MKPILCIVLVVLVAFASGCATGVATDLSVARTDRSALEGVSPIDSVRLDEAFLLTTDTYTNMGVPSNFTTGKLWKSMFTGDARAPGVLYLESHQLHQHTNPAAWVVPMPSWISYKVTCVLEIDGERHEMRAEGKCGAYMRWVEGTRIAVDVVIADIAKQVREVVAQHSPRSSAREPDVYVHLRKLKELLDEGIITQEEFEMQKNKLLNGKADEPGATDNSGDAQ